MKAIQGQQEIPSRTALKLAIGVPTLVLFALSMVMMRWSMLGWVGAFVTILVSNVTYFVLQRRLFRTHGYDWYKRTFPSAVLSSGRVSCRHCDSQNVDVRNLFEKTFHRAHLCRRCGKTLYFSPE